MKTPAILIMTVTLMMIGILVLEFHLSNQSQDQLIPEDYSELLTSVQNLDSNILLIGEDLPFPESIKHQVVSSIDDLEISNLGQIDFIIIHISNHLANPIFSTDQIEMLKLYNEQGASIIFVGLVNYDFLEIDHDISVGYPREIGVIKLNPNSFDLGNYEIHIPTTSNLELRLYNVLRMMVPR
jgi:hypothetical protein